jgi:hypothetical protein
MRAIRYLLFVAPWPPVPRVTMSLVFRPVPILVLRGWVFVLLISLSSSDLEGALPFLRLLQKGWVLSWLFSLLSTLHASVTREPSRHINPRAKLVPTRSRLCLGGPHARINVIRHSFLPCSCVPHPLDILDRDYPPPFRQTPQTHWPPSRVVVVLRDSPRESRGALDLRFQGLASRPQVVASSPKVNSSRTRTSHFYLISVSYICHLPSATRSRKTTQRASIKLDAS